ncbi:hypothetical protein LCGC14_1062950 [marine sediment metagenome]|uniref:Uncharacterized protein n=1 Tax=marine sediment metagenome TaxID=412755 RepID=A0A0F9N7K3_9ZZZZ
MVKETGIISSGNHPKLILSGEKTMTRRTSGLDKVNAAPDKWIAVRRDQMIGIPLDTFIFHNKEDRMGDGESIRELIKCPYGQVGDRLWVRETWAYAPWQDDLPPRELSEESGLLAYKACPEDINYCLAGKWRPSIFMPRWASRITLEITEVRVERVQEITNGDARWEVNLWVWVISFKVVK